MAVVTMQELERLDRAYRARLLLDAIAETEREISQRASEHAPTDALERSLTRLSRAAHDLDPKAETWQLERELSAMAGRY